MTDAFVPITEQTLALPCDDVCLTRHEKASNAQSKSVCKTVRHVSEISADVTAYWERIGLSGDKLFMSRVAAVDGVC